MLVMMRQLAHEKEIYFETLTNENMVRYKKFINTEKLYREMKNYPHTFYMSLKERMAKTDSQNLKRGEKTSNKEEYA